MPCPSLEGPSSCCARPPTSGKLAGGMRVEPERKAPLVILLTDDLDAVLARVGEAGGKILGPDHVFPGGRRFHFLDPAGNEVAVWTKG